MTNHKKRILDFLIEHKDRHHTIDEIIQGLDGDKKPGKSTVYRQISSLLEDGVVRRFEAAGEDSFVYQYAVGVGCDHHFHLKCAHCGNLLHMECDKLSEVRRHILDDHGFLIGGSSIIYGVCADCRKEKTV
jgi:Fur family ferric uptake transcriptional regulator